MIGGSAQNLGAQDSAENELISTQVICFTHTLKICIPQPKNYLESAEWRLKLNTASVRFDIHATLFQNVWGKLGP